MESIQIIILAIIQGITEWLPISSTAHLIIARDLLSVNLTEEFWYLFSVVVQLGSVLAVIILYFNQLNPIVKNKKESIEKWILWLKIVVATIPAAILGFFLDDLIAQVLSETYVIAITLILFGIFFLYFDKNKIFSIENTKDITYKTALIVGLFQALAIIPGTSRSGATILGCIILGFNRKTASEFSFFMALPVMFGASLLRLLKSNLAFSNQELFYLALGTVVSLLVSLLVIKQLIKFVKTHSFKVFAYYRIILAILLILYILFN